MNPKQAGWLKKFACYDFAIKHIKSENNIGADVLSKKPNYKNLNKLTKLMLIKNSNYMQIAETTEENQNIIRNAHDTKSSGHQGILKTLEKTQKTTTWKSIKADVKKTSKIARFTQ